MCLSACLQITQLTLLPRCDEQVRGAAPRLPAVRAQAAGAARPPRAASIGAGATGARGRRRAAEQRRGSDPAAAAALHRHGAVAAKREGRRRGLHPLLPSGAWAGMGGGYWTDRHSAFFAQVNRPMNRAIPSDRHHSPQTGARGGPRRARPRHRAAVRAQLRSASTPRHDMVSFMTRFDRPPIPSPNNTHNPHP